MSRELTFNERAVLEMVEAAAKAGKPCPRNAAITDATGITDPSFTLRSLVRKGRVKLESGNCRRVVTILATGLKTAGKITEPHWRQAKGKRKPSAGRGGRPKVETPAQLAEIPRVERGACFWCGTRFDGHRCSTCRRVAA